MAIDFRSPRWARIQKTFGLVVFVGILLWPPVHAAASKIYGFSSWRLFGWGMYATPHPDSLSNLSLIILPRPVSNAEALHVYQEFRSKFAQRRESDCLDVLVSEEGHPLRDLNVGEPCNSRRVETDIAYFRHFHSTTHLADLVDVFSPPGKSVHTASLAVFERQRFNLEKSRAFVESELYFIDERIVRYLGKFP